MRTVALLASAAAALAQAPQPNPGYTDTPLLPGLPYRVHDPGRPHPRMVVPAAQPGGAPSDAIILFDGRSLAQWKSRAPWKVENGYMEVVAGAGNLSTVESFGDIQLHLEWAAPAEVRGASQDRGNSGVFLQGLYEVQVLDSFDNVTYADGQAGALYGQWPPQVNASRRPGEWQSYDIVFEAPRFDSQRVLVQPAHITVFHNGVLVHHRQPLMGPTVHRALPQYRQPPAEGPIVLQDHGNPVRYRNIWVRRLTGYDRPE